MQIGDVVNTCLNSKAMNKTCFTGRRELDVSRLANPCNRALQYEAQGLACSRQPNAHRAVRTRDMAKTIKDLVSNWLNDIGLKVQRNDSIGRPFEYRAAEGKMVGRIDGVVLGGPKIHGYPCLWFCLPMGPRRFRETMEKGLEETNAAEFSLVALHQKYMGLTHNPALLTVIDKESLEMEHVSVPFDSNRCQTLNDRAALILMACRSGERLPRLASNPDHYECRWCGYRSRCWETF